MDNAKSEYFKTIAEAKRQSEIAEEKNSKLNEMDEQRKGGRTHRRYMEQQRIKYDKQVAEGNVEYYNKAIEHMVYSTEPDAKVYVDEEGNEYKFTPLMVSLIDDARKDDEEYNRKREGAKQEIRDALSVRETGGTKKSLSDVFYGNREFKEHIAGTDIGNDPVALFESYARSVLEKIAPETLEDLEKVSNVAQSLNEEARKDDLDIHAVDCILADFLYKKFENLWETIDQRIRYAAERFVQYYKEERNLEDAEKYQVSNRGVPEWVQDLQYIKKEVLNSLNNAKSIMLFADGSSDRAKKLGAVWNRLDAYCNPLQWSRK